MGLDNVRVGELDLDLMGDDVDPQTRLTIGKSIGSWLDLLLSQNLRESGFTWAVTVHPAGSVQVRFVSKDSETTSVQLAHEIVFGKPGNFQAAAKPATKAERPVPRIAALTVDGGGLPEGTVLAATKLRVGDAFDFFEWQRDRERIESLFRARGYLRVQVSATRSPSPAGDAAVALRYQVRRGPLTTLDVTGFELPEDVLSGMKTAWSESVDDRFLEEDLHARARAAMVDLGYLQSEVTVAIDAGVSRETTARIGIAPGPRTLERQIVFQGRLALSDRDLLAELATTGAGAAAWREPAAAAAALEAFYRRRGFLAAKVTAAPFQFSQDTVRLPIAIDEGLRHQVSRIDIRGAEAASVGRVQQWLGWRVGDAYNPADTEAAAKRVEAGYVSDGYRAARATVKAAVEPGTARVDVIVDVRPGVRSVVGEVQVVGRGETRETIVRRAIDMPPGSAASAATADRAQRRLYETEAFRSVDVRLVPIAEGVAAPAAEPAEPAKLPQPGAAPATGLEPTRVVVTLEEAPLYRLRYGVQLTDDLTAATQISELRLGVSAELRRRNLFGTALNLGIGGRYEVGNYSGRAALTIPTSVFWPALSTLYFKQSLSTDQGETGPIETVETAVTYQERWRLGQRSELSYGYTFTREQLRYSLVTRSEEPAGPTHRGNLFAAIALDRRDSGFNATRGWFQSSSLEYGAPEIGSDFSYLRYLFQQTYYKKLGGIVFAGAGRVGVLVHLTGDDDQTYSLRFRTGGDRTVRGYDLESLTAPGESGAMVGGRGLLILNGEARFPVWRWLKAATFIDAGNAFVDPAHISLGDLKVGTGFGIRLDTPYALFRLDVGFPLPQNSPTLIRRWYFSIGQAF